MTAVSRYPGWILLVLLTLTVRGAVAWQQFDSLRNDRDNYRRLAAGLAAGEGLVHPEHGGATAYRPPLYPLILASVARVGGGDLGLFLLHLVLGLSTVLMTWQLGSKLELGHGAWWAALLVAGDPLLVGMATQPMTETLITALVTALLLVACQAPFGRRGLTLGLLFGLAVLCRPSLWLLGGLAGVAWVLRRRRSGSDTPVILDRVTLVTVSLGLAVTVGPWLVRNLVVGGTPVLTTTHGGFTLLLGNNPVFYRQVVRRDWGTVWNEKTSDPGETPAQWRRNLEHRLPVAWDGIASERQRDSWMYRRAWSHISNDPGGFLHACLLRGVRFWSPLSLEFGLSPLLKWGTAAWYTLLTLAMLGGLLRRPQRQVPAWQGSLLLLISLTAVHLVFWSTLRMRAPLVPVIALLAVVGVINPSGRSDG